MTKSTSNMIFIDGSLLIIEAMARAGAGAYIGYPITPVNRLFDGAKRRIPIALEAPDEITALQWSAGFSSTGNFPVTASAFPGFALMIESINSISRSLFETALNNGRESWRNSTRIVRT